MQPRRLPQHWPRSPSEARRVQEELRRRVVTVDRFGVVRQVTGVDAHYESSGTWAAAVTMTLPDLTSRETAVVRRSLTFPYVPGLLSFREAPALLAALHRLTVRPDLLLVDGHGLAHPRRFGLACHVGVLADLPTIGVAKSRLIGSHDEPGMQRGAWTPLIDHGEMIGAVLRTRCGVRPVYVSIGHRISLETAIAFVLRCTGRFRLPEPIRAADRLSRQHSVK